MITTVAGSGGRGFGGNGGPATEAYFLNPYDVTVDPEGRLLVADTLNGQVRRVEQDGTINALAGVGGDGSDRGDGGPAISASLTTAHSVGCQPDGKVYIGDMTGRHTGRGPRDGHHSKHLRAPARPVIRATEVQPPRRALAAHHR